MHIAQLDVRIKEKVGMFFKNSDYDYLPDKQKQQGKFSFQISGLS